MSPRPDYGILLGLAYQTFTDELRADLAARGFNDLGNTYGYVFRALSTEALRSSELAARLGMTAQGASKLVDEMAARGYVERIADPHDGRAKELRLAPRGREALACARYFHAAYERRLRSRLGEGEIETVRRALEAMLASAGLDPANAALRAL